MVLHLPDDSWSNWNLKVLFFGERGTPGYPEKKPLGAKERTGKQINNHDPHMALMLRFDPRPH